MQADAMLKGPLPARPHVLRWVREQLGLTQKQVGEMIGASYSTVQSIELGRLTLSERYAYRLQQSLRVPAKWLIANDWERLPDSRALRETFENSWRYGFDQSYPDLLVSRLQILRTYVLLRAVLEELGYHGANASGFYKILRQAQTDLVGTIADKELRGRIYQKVVDETLNPLAVLKIVEQDCRNICEMLTADEKRKKAERKHSPFREPDKIIARWDRKEDRVRFFDKDSNEALTETEALKPGYKLKSHRAMKPPADLPKDTLPLWQPNQPVVIYYDVAGSLVEVSFLKA